MVPRGRGSIFFTGASASMRGNEGFSAFSAGKSGLRALAQSMARELGPQNIHVAHLVIDAGVDTAFVRDIWMKTGDRSGDDAAGYIDGSEFGRSGLLDPVSSSPGRLDVRNGFYGLLAKPGER